MTRGDFRFAFTFRIRYSEVDGQSVVFNAHYLTFFDTAITEYFRWIGYDYVGETKATGVDFHTAKSLVEYKAPIRFDEEIEVGVPGKFAVRGVRRGCVAGCGFRRFDGEFRRVGPTVRTHPPIVPHDRDESRTVVQIDTQQLPMTAASGLSTGDPRRYTADPGHCQHDVTWTLSWPAQNSPAPSPACPVPVRHFRWPRTPGA